MSFGAPIRSKSNARVKALRASFNGKAPQPGDLLGIEGEHLIAEALRAGMNFGTVFTRQGSESIFERASLAHLARGNVTVLSPEVFSSVVDTESPQGVAATVTIASSCLDPNAQGPALILEDLQDPGNLGTLLRTAEAFGARQVMTTPGTVNPWNLKAVRASAGSVFRMPLLRAPLAQIAAELAQRGSPIFAAVARQENAVSLTEINFPANCALLIGNEGAGLSHEALAMAQHRVWIPCAVESLNAAVAGSTFLYEAMRQREALR